MHYIKAGVKFTNTFRCIIYHICDNARLVESKMGAVILGFRWLLASLSIRRLSPTCHDSVSHPRSSNGHAELPHPAFRLASPQGTRWTTGLIGLGSITPSSPNTRSEGNRLIPREGTLCRSTRKRLTRLYTFRSTARYAIIVVP